MGALRSGWLVSLFLWAAASAGAAPAQGPAELKSEFDRWAAAYDKGDLDGTMRIFAPDVVFQFQGGKDQGYDDLKRGYVGDFATRKPGTTWVPRIEEVHVEGSIGFVRSIWELRVKSPSGEAQVKARNRSVDILTRKSGDWRIIRSFNYPDK